MCHPPVPYAAPPADDPHPHLAALPPAPHEHLVRFVLWLGCAVRKLDKPCTSCSTGGKHWGHGFLLQAVKEVKIYRRGMFGGREGEDKNNSGSKIVKY